MPRVSLLFAIAILGAPPPAAAEAASLRDVCSYLEDVRGIPRNECLARPGRIDAAIMREGSRQAPERGRQVKELALRFAYVEKTSHQILAVLDVWGRRLSPPLNERTFPAWLAAEDPLRPRGLVAAAVALWLRERAAGPPGVPKKASANSEQMLAKIQPRLIAPEAEAAARAMDGSLPQEKRDFPVPGGTPPQQKTGGEGPPATTSPAPHLSDLGVDPPPVVPSVEIKKAPPLIRPGSDQPHESLLLSIDPKADPCVDFYQYACGKWIKEHPLGGSNWRDRWTEIQHRNNARLRDIVRKLSTEPSSNPDEAKLGDYFASCTDRRTIDALGTAPLRDDLSRIQAISDIKGLARVVAHFHGQGLRALFSFGAERDYKNAQEVIPAISQGGYALPREYYLEGAYEEKLFAYENHITKMFILLGEEPRQAADDAGATLRIEAGLARISLSTEKLRDPVEWYHRMPLEKLEELAPSFPWEEYLEEIQAPPILELNVVPPAFFQGFERLLANTPIEDWKAYLRWRLLNASAQQLPEAFSRQESKFKNILQGGKGSLERWNQCVYEINDAMGEALGSAYVKRHFDKSAKQAMAQLAGAIKAALKDDIEHAVWMEPGTREYALKKIAAMSLKVGYPEHPLDYRGLDVVRGDAYGNARRTGAFAFRRDLAKIGRPVDKTAWEMSAPEVNAYYNTQNNEIVFPAGILQPPFFDPEGEPAVNFGAIGAIVGHEMTHGFDDQGRLFDAEGNLRDWWTDKDSKSFQEKAQRFVAQYSGYPLIPGQKQTVNARLTLGENIADNGGLRLAYKAFRSLAGTKRGADGFTPEQSFFLGFGRTWCGNVTQEMTRLWAVTNPHAPDRVRVNGPVSNMPEFQQAFNCKPDSPMVRREPSRLW